MIVLDAGKPVTHKFLIERELDNFGIRLNEKPPCINIKKKERGGVDFQWLCPQTKGVTQDVAARILREYPPRAVLSGALGRFVAAAATRIVCIAATRAGRDLDRRRGGAAGPGSSFDPGTWIVLGPTRRGGAGTASRPRPWRSATT